MRTLYLQRMPSLCGYNAFSGRRLFDHFAEDSEETLLSFAVVEDEEAESTHLRASRDWLSITQCKRFNPDVIYIEGGLFYFYGEDWRWRIPRKLLEHLSVQGTITIIADIDRNMLYQQKHQYRNAGDFLGAYAAYSVSDLDVYDNDSAIYGIDETHRWKHSSQNVICRSDKMFICDWIRPVYDGISEILAVSPSLLITQQSSYVASCNSDSSATLHNDRWVNKPDCCTFAVARQHGIGYVVPIAAQVSHDSITQYFPSNTHWLTRLATFLLSHAAKDKQRRTSRYHSPFKLFLSHKSTNKQYVGDISEGLGRVGIDFWLDEEQIIPSASLVDEIARGLAEMTHFVLFWSQDCVDAPWVKRELNAAVMKLVENNIPIFVVRLDTTPVPEIIGDLLWIDADKVTSNEVVMKIAEAVKVQRE